MRIFLLVSTLLLTPMAGFCGDPPGTAAQPPVAFVGGTIIDGRGGAPITDGVVLIQNDRIRAVGSASTVHIPAHAQKIDISGRSILPGLADMHVHLGFAWDGETPDMLAYQRYLNALLYAGVTTVLDTGNVMPYILQLREEVAAGRIAGPRIYAVGPLVDGLDPYWPPISFVLASESQAAKIVELLATEKVDAIKAYKGLSIPLLRALVDSGKKHSLPVIADMWARTGSYDVAATGVTAIAHLPARTVDDSTLDLLRDNQIKVITTLAAKESFSRERFADLQFLEHPLVTDAHPPGVRAALRKHALQSPDTDGFYSVERWQKSLRIGKANALKLHRSGVILVAGTDAPYPGTFLGEGLHRELELLVESGLTPLQALTAATHNAARLMEDDDWGTLEPGKQADLIVVRGRPDISIGNTRNVEIVMQRGHLIDRAKLAIPNQTKQEPMFRNSQFQKTHELQPEQD